MMTVVGPTLDLWPEVKKFYSGFKVSQWATRINVDERQFESYYTASLFAGSMVGTLVLLDSLHGVIGLAVLSEIRELLDDGRLAARTFLRGVHILPGCGRIAGDILNDAVEEWAKVRGHDMVIAYTRFPAGGVNNFKYHACQERYGFKPLYTVIGREVKKDG